MRRRVLMALLALGAVGGYASAFHRGSCARREQREAFEHHVARVCVEAARGTPAGEPARGAP